MNKNIKNIIFDYGNVIFTIDFKRTQAAFEALGITNVEEFYAHKGHHEIFDQFEKGEITAAEFRDGIRTVSKHPELTDQQIDDTWNSLLIGVPTGNHELLLALKGKYRTFLLSNINEIHLDYINKYLKETFSLAGNEGFFEKIYYSHLVGKRKPNAAIFKQVLAENNLNPNETLFIDDSPQHLKTATDMGIQTYLMTYPDTIQKLFNSQN
ncbi:MAG: HAD family phosphatase [Bacteroidetes bacterium]|nr:HAD family phosphatase [Bacteroidota bacterium]MBU1372173.1 HAD family phosphatase [Bacteroidota bacterium]MBU1483349.1 HAD family phosphatase [Bacteroidota bacterium]MBU1761167.1 HAD family phosphatase [Bacteroidota bacterium]MBU2267029.1 HAD family phosphatase [Bacteroidota bacterium]